MISNGRRPEMRSLCLSTSKKDFSLVNVLVSAQVLHHTNDMITLHCPLRDNSLHTFTNPLKAGLTIIFVHNILNVGVFECTCLCVCTEEGLWWLFLLEQYQAEVWDDFRFSLLSVSMLCIPAQPASDYQDLVVLSRECNKEGMREFRKKREREGTEEG